MVVHFNTAEMNLYRLQEEKGGGGGGGGGGGEGRWGSPVTFLLLSQKSEEGHK